MQLVGLILWYLLWAYLAILMIRAVLSFIPLFVREWQPRGIVLVIAEFVYTLTDPPLRFMRKIIPPVGSAPPVGIWVSWCYSSDCPSCNA